MNQAPDLLCQEIAGTQAILRHDSKQSCFKEAALLAQETAAAEDKGKLQAMLFAMLQEQHNRKNVTMTANWFSSCVGHILPKNLAFWYKSYGFVDLIKFLRTK